MVFLILNENKNELGEFIKQSSVKFNTYLKSNNQPNNNVVTPCNKTRSYSIFD